MEGLQAPTLSAMLTERARRNLPAALLVVAPTGRRAESLAAAISSYLPTATVRTFPAWETLPHERLSPSAETVGRRLAILREIQHWTGPEPLVITASVRAALQPVAAGLGDADEIHLTIGARSHDLAEISERLVALAYHRVDLVTRRGEFAVRGGILDVFAPDGEHPVRVDFFGDEVDGIRGFSVADQRSLPGEISSVVLGPSRELLLTDSVRTAAAELADRLPGMSSMLERMAQGIPADGMESLLPVVSTVVP